jgi:mgtE-like transporter
MSLFPHRVGARFGALVRADLSGVRAGFVALLISTGTGLIAGLTLGSITGTLEKLPGIMILVPAAVGMRGNVFGALGSRLGTAVHTGTYRWSWRIDALVGQNLASRSLSMSLAFLLAIVAKGFAVAFGVNHRSRSPTSSSCRCSADHPDHRRDGDHVATTTLSVRNDWDLDDVAAPS